jgi:hypothetical protein
MLFLYCECSCFSEFCCYSLSVDIILWLFMLMFECCYSVFVYVILWEFMLFLKRLCYYQRVVILGILLFLECLYYTLNVCVIATCCCTVNLLILCIFAFFWERLYYSLSVDIVRVLLLFSECQYSVNIYVILRNCCYSLNVFVVLWIFLLLSYRVLKGHVIYKSDYFVLCMSV